MTKAKEKVPHNLILKWTAQCLTEFHSDPSLAEFQQWLELQAQVYDKVNRENLMRNAFPNSKKFGNTNLNTNTACRSYTSQPLYSLVFNQERNQKHQLQQKTAKTITALQLALNTSFFLLMIDIALLAKTYFVQICLSNKLHKQRCPSTKRCQMCSGFDHCMTQQNKSNNQQQIF